MVRLMDEIVAAAATQSDTDRTCNALPPLLSDGAIGITRQTDSDPCKMFSASAILRQIRQFASQFIDQLNKRVSREGEE